MQGANQYRLPGFESWGLLPKSQWISQTPVTKKTYLAI
jgi:hypothetical protein